jgi:altronate dehydratase
MGNTSSSDPDDYTEKKQKRFKKRIKVYTHQVQNNGQVATQKERFKREEQKRILEIRKQNLERIKEKVENESEVKDFFIRGIKVKSKGEDRITKRQRKQITQ